MMFVAGLLALGLSAQNKNISELSEVLKDLKWETPKMTGIQSVDEVYELSDKLFKSVEAMDSIPIYSLRSIVENGDTVAIVVVNQFNQPYSSLSAVTQIASGASRLATIANNAVGLSSRYVKLASELPTILKSEGFGSIKIISAVSKNSSKVAKLAKNVIPKVKDMYEKKGNPIKAYNNAQKSLGKEDGFVTTGFDHVPEFAPSDMPSDEELDMILEQERANRS